MRIPKMLVSAMLWMTGLSTLGATGCYVGETPPEGYYNGAPGPAQVAAGPDSGDPQIDPQTGEPAQIYTQSLPPDPIAESPPPAPVYGQVWIDGYWNWSGAEWIWFGGRWAPPRMGYAYIEPYYDYVGSRYVYTPGFWCNRNRLPVGVVLHGNLGAGRPLVAYHSTVNVNVSNHPGGHVVYPRGGAAQAVPAAAYHGQVPGPARPAQGAQPGRYYAPRAQPATRAPVRQAPSRPAPARSAPAQHSAPSRPKK